MLKALEMENIRSYKRERIEFREGVALFEGDIGSGKSTILYSIEFALFGLGDLKSTALLRSGEKEGSVKLTMDVGGSDIVFMRSLERKKNGASQKQCCIIAGGIRTDYSPEEMKQKVLQMLKFNENPSPSATSLIYRYAIFTPQEEMKEILRLREDMRLETLRRAFGIEEYRTARNNAALVSREIRQREAFLSGGLADAESLASEKSEKLAAFGKACDELEKLSAKSGALMRKCAAVKKSIEEQRKIKAEHDKLAGELLSIKKMREDKKKLIETARKRISQIDAEIAERKRRIELLESEKKPTEKTEEEIFEELKIIRQDISRLSSKIGAVKNAIEEAESAAKEAEGLRGQLAKIAAGINIIGEIRRPTEKTDSELAARILEARGRTDALLREMGAKKEHADTFRELIERNVCPTCGENIEPEKFRKKSRDALAALGSIQDRLGALAAEENAAKSERERLSEYGLKKEKLEGLLREKALVEKSLDSAAKKQFEIEPLCAELAGNVKALDELSEKEKSLAAVLGALQAFTMARAQSIQMHADLNSATQRLDSESLLLESASSELSSIEHEIAEKEREIAKKKESAKILSELEDEVGRLDAQQAMLAKSIGVCGGARDSLSAEIAKIDAQIKRKDEEKAELLQLSRTRMWLDECFAIALASIERHVLAGINEEFNTLLRRMFRILMDESELNIGINEFFTPAVLQNGYEQDINALSGGERTSVALAYRLALNSMVKEACAPLNKSGLLILDEPTDGFSKEQLMRLRDVLAETGARQIIIVSHERELESFADCIYRVRKSGNVSVVEKG